MKKFTLFLVGLIACLQMQAYDFSKEGIYYNIISTADRTVEVTYYSRSPGTYSGNVVIPSAVLEDGKKWTVTSIGDYAFYTCSSLASVTIPNSVTTIGDHAFSYCSSLASVTIPNSVTTIGQAVFISCKSLISIEVDPQNQNFTSVDGILYNKDVTTLTVCPGGKSLLTIPNSVTSIGDYAFNGCSSLTSVSIPNSVTKIGNSAFSGCSSLTSVTIGNSVTTIGGRAFRNCSSLTSVTIPNSVTSIGAEAFCYCDSLASVTIGNSVTTIGDSTFSYCSSLTSVTIPNSVTSIGDRTFSDCSSLTSVTIPNSVTSIGEYAFYSCRSLSSVTCLATTPPSAISNTFDESTLINAKLFVPEESLKAYNSVDPWRNFFNIEAINGSGIEDVSTNQLIYTFSYGVLTLSQMPRIPWILYDLNGKLTNKCESLSLYGVEPGIYIINIDGKSFKVCLK